MRWLKNLAFWITFTILYIWYIAYFGTVLLFSRDKVKALQSIDDSIPSEKLSPEEWEELRQKLENML